MKCNMCNGNLENFEYKGTHIWICEQCPNIQFEYYSDDNIKKVDMFMQLRNNKSKSDLITFESFMKYERVRKSGKYNMFDAQAIRESGLDTDTYLLIMKCYSLLSEKYLV